VRRPGDWTPHHASARFLCAFSLGISRPLLNYYVPAARGRQPRRARPRPSILFERTFLSTLWLVISSVRKDPLHGKTSPLPHSSSYRRSFPPTPLLFSPGFLSRNSGGSRSPLDQLFLTSPIFRLGDRSCPPMGLGAVLAFQMRAHSPLFPVTTLSSHRYGKEYWEHVTFPLDVGRAATFFVRRSSSPFAFQDFPVLRGIPLRPAS